MKKKTLMTILCVCLIITASVMATLAFLTDRDSVLNTFTVGDVQIELDETKVDENGVPVPGADRTEDGNNYHLIPGQTYVKDPVVTVNANSEESYVRMLVTFNKMAELDAIFAPTGADLTSIFNGYDANKWKFKGKTEDAAANMITYEFRYFEPVKKTNQDVELDALFDSITVPGSLTKEQLATLKADPTTNMPGFQISIEGHAIQKATFDNEDAAWAAFQEQWKNQ